MTDETVVEGGGLISRISVKAQFIAVATLLVIGLQAALLFYTIRNHEVVVYDLAVRDREATTAINSLSVSVNDYSSRMVGVMGGIYAAPGTAARIVASHDNIQAGWKTVLAQLEPFLDKTSVEEAKVSIEKLPAFTEKVRVAYSDNNRAAFERLYDEWLDYSPALIRFVTTVRDRVRAAAAENKHKAEQQDEQVTNLTYLSLGLGLLVLFGNWFVLTYQIAGPVRRMAEAMTSLAAGKVGGEVQGTGRNDEIGMMARALRIFRDQAISSSELTDRVVQSIRQVASAANQASSAVSQVSDGSYTQLNALKQVANSLEQSSTAIADVARSTQMASEQAKSAATLAASGIQQMGSMVEVVNAIAHSSAQIDQITGAIQRIASQTNMLSLNAAIEAARAGEHGKGFAVVAEEVRKLAENSGTLAQEIAGLVKQATEQARRGVAMAEDVSSNMHQIADGVRQSDKLVGAIATAMEEQQATVGGINANVSELTRIGQSNSTAAEEITATMLDLSKLADKTRGEVDQFKRIVVN